MKHFKLNIERNYIPVADLCIAGIPEDDYNSVVKVFTKVLNDCPIPFDFFEKKDDMLIAKRIVVSWSISE